MAEDHDVVADASQQHEYVEYFVLAPSVADMDLQGIDDASDRIQQSAQQQPEETRS